MYIFAKIFIRMFFKCLKSKELCFIVVLFTLLRFVAVLLMELSPQDAYYSYYSENLALSYFDHPPMVAYMIWFFSLFLGRSEIALHVTNFIVTSGTILFTFIAFKPFLSKIQSKLLLILLLSAPYITILSINTTPDIPLLFFWSVSLLLFRYILFGKGSLTSDNSQLANHKADWYLWLFVGISCGFAFDSKYTGIFLPASFVLFLLLSSEHRKLLFTWKFLLFCFAFLLAISPVIVWNIQNDFISFKYQSADRASDIATFQFKPKFFIGFFISQLVIALPILFLWMYKASFKVFFNWIKSLFKSKIIDSLSSVELFLACFVAPLLFIFSALSIIYWVKLNWIMPSFLAGSILVVIYLTKEGRGISFLRYQTFISLILHVGLLVQLIWMPFKIKSDDTWWGWDDLADKTEEVKRSTDSHFIFSDNSYKVSAVLNFYLDEHIYGGNVIDNFAFQFELDNPDLSYLKDKDAVYVLSDRYKKQILKYTTVEELLSPYFESVKLVDSLVLFDNDGDEFKRFYFYDCEDYSPEAKQIK